MVNNEKTIRSVITPNDQFLRTVFSTSKAYFIDIYQELKCEPVGPDSTGAFPIDKVDGRQQLLFNAIKHIWCEDSVPWRTY